MSRCHTKLGIMIAMLIAAAALAATSFQKTNAFINPTSGFSDQRSTKGAAAPIATSGSNVYVTWSSNKTGNDEVMFKVSIDGGKTFADKMNLSNSPKSESQDAQIAAAGNNVYVTWWERNTTTNEPVLRVSNDNGKTFGEKIMLSAK
jgi:archaellin